MNPPVTHEPVMVNEVLAVLAPRDEGNYIDGTFGGGGHGRAILEAANCRVWGIDRDPDAIRQARRLIQHYDARLTVAEGRFGDMDTLFADQLTGPVDGITFDLGVSSMQLDSPERGFSFRLDGPLDMRQERCGRSAQDLVNECSELELADILFRLGGERQSRRVARAIVAARTREPITTTGQLAAIVRNAVKTSRNSRIDPATRTFQAIRICINRELEELERGLSAAENILAPGGRLAVISFHSLEDTIVKRFLRDRSGRRPTASRHAPSLRLSPQPPTFRELGRSVLKPTTEEITRNPRARSARLRAAERMSTLLSPPTQG